MLKAPIYTLFLFISTTFLLSALSEDMSLASKMYMYAWPLVMSNLTRTSMWYLPDNFMLPMPVFPNPNLTAIVKPNVDTLYSACWINHENQEDIVLTVPDTTEGVYYLFPLMDAWTNIVNSPGWRTTDKDELKVLIRGPFSEKEDPLPDEEYDMVMHSTTSSTYLLGRTNVADQSNLSPTQEQMFSYRLLPADMMMMEQDKKSPANAVGGNAFLASYGDDAVNPVEQILAMSASEFYSSFAALMLVNPPILPQDQEIVDQMAAEYGLFAGKDDGWSFNSSLSPEQQMQLSTGMSVGKRLMFAYPVKRVNGWTLPDMRTGNYSDNYYFRSYIALRLYAANVPQDAVYYETELFEGGQDKVYELHFSSSNSSSNNEHPPPPPCNEYGFWSITMYSQEGYLVPNENSTYSISSQQKLKYTGENEDILRITISVKQPTDLSVTNWLPAPQAGENFSLTMRVYWPLDAVLNEEWLPPAVMETK